MRSVADQLRDEDRARVAALSPEARVALSLRLGEMATEILGAARTLPRARAVQVARSLRNRGRRRSGSASR